MFTASETAVTSLIVIIALGVLGWGFYRARPFGKAGILAWLQSVVLMAPWLLLFGLFSIGIYINLVGVLGLLAISTGLYIYLGSQLRTIGRDMLQQRAQQLPQQQESSPSAEETSPLPASTTESKVASAEDMPRIAETDLKAIQSIFSIDTFFATETIAHQEGAIFRGNLRGEADSVYAKLSAKLQEVVGERYRLFLVENPDGKPVVITLPSSSDPKTATNGQKLLSIGLLAATIATTLSTAGLFFGFDFFSNLGRVQELIPLSLGIWAILGAHELGHKLVADRYQVRLGPPFFIPAIQIGSFGAVTRFESLLPTRSVLFDISLAGPALGGLASFIFLLGGLVLSKGSGDLVQFPSQFFQGSMLVGTLAKIVLGNQLSETVIGIHPLTIIGWLGLVITALNLMPAGQLDGGRIVQAIYGRKTARRTTIATLVLLAILSIVNPGNPLILYWAIVILFLQRDLERPSKNELSEPDDARAALALLALFLTIVTLLPLSPGLAGRLGIGG